MEKKPLHDYFSVRILTAIFSGGLGVSRYQNVSILDFIGANGDESSGVSWNYKTCKAPVTSSPPTNQHPTFLQTGCPSCNPTNSARALKGKVTDSGSVLTCVCVSVCVYLFVSVYVSVCAAAPAKLVSKARAANRQRLHSQGTVATWCSSRCSRMRLIN